MRQTRRLRIQLPNQVEGSAGGEGALRSGTPNEVRTAVCRGASTYLAFSFSQFARSGTLKPTGPGALLNAILPSAPTT